MIIYILTMFCTNILFSFAHDLHKSAKLLAFFGAFLPERDVNFIPGPCGPIQLDNRFATALFPLLPHLRGDARFWRGLRQ